MKEKLLITGGSGFLGSNIAFMASKYFDVFATYLSHPHQILGCQLVALDVRDRIQAGEVFRIVKPDLVIHTVALVDVDYCEGHPEDAISVNVGGTRNIALACKEIGAKMIYISTDSVFDGKKGMYEEKDAPFPMNVYAKTKLEGGLITQDIVASSIIARTAFYGWHPISSSTLSLAEWVIGGLREGRELNMFSDVFFTPIFVNNLAQVLMEMFHAGLSGIYHVGGSQRCSKFEFGQAIAQAFGLDKNRIHAVSIDEANLRSLRPKDISLDIAKISQVGSIHTRLFDFEDGIALFRGLEHSLGGGNLYL